ncbi:MAG: hypothetical protein HWD58_02215 [Bacteroidota bacterium]|nr:MAG: hypothetical protein HWD58_02215 [Bacteroidota bacterium]
MMNEVLSLYAVDEISHCTLYELTGILEQKQHNTAMRMSLQEIEEINVTPSAIGFIVNCRCAAQMTCFNLVKSDMSSNPVAEHVFSPRSDCSQYAWILFEQIESILSEGLHQGSVYCS